MGDANDPEVYTAAIIAVLSHFSEDVVRRVVDPNTGLPAQIKWLPTPKEVRDACIQFDGQDRRLREWKAGAAAQLAERERLEALSGRVTQPRYSPHRANVLVRKELPLYREMIERAAAATDTKEFQYDDVGIWVAESWIRNPRWA